MFIPDYFLDDFWNTVDVACLVVNAFVIDSIFRLLWMQMFQRGFFENKPMGDQVEFVWVYWGVWYIYSYINIKVQIRSIHLLVTLHLWELPCFTTTFCSMAWPDWLLHCNRKMDPIKNHKKTWKGWKGLTYLPGFMWNQSDFWILCVKAISFCQLSKKYLQQETGWLVAFQICFMIF